MPKEEGSLKMFGDAIWEPYFRIYGLNFVVRDLDPDGTWLVSIYRSLNTIPCPLCIYVYMYFVHSNFTLFEKE